MKKPLFITLLIFIVVLIISNIYFLSHFDKCICSVKEHSEKEVLECKCYVSEKLKLSDVQSVAYEKIKKDHQNKASIIIDSLHINQEMMMNYLSGNNSEKETLDYYQDKISNFQRLLLDQSLNQFLELKSILNPNQIESANEIFRGLFVCRPTCDHNHNN